MARLKIKTYTPFYVYDDNDNGKKTYDFKWEQAWPEFLGGEYDENSDMPNFCICCGLDIKGATEKDEVPHAVNGITIYAGHLGKPGEFNGPVLVDEGLSSKINGKGIINHIRCKAGVLTVVAITKMDDN